MSSLQKLMRQRWQALLLVLLAGGFAMTVLELLLTDHFKGIQVVGIIAPAVALVAVLVGLFAGDGLRRVLALVLLVTALAGVLGTFEHFEEGGGRQVQAIGIADAAGYQPVRLTSAVAGQEGDEHFEGSESGEGRESGESREGSEGGAPPPLAPLAITGLALMGAVVLFVPREQPA